MMINLQEVKSSLLNYTNMIRTSKKYSYIIVKPNGEKHFASILKSIRSYNLTIERIYKIDDYESVNILLHPEKEKQKYILPINRVYKDFFSNYAILILVSESNISYDILISQIVKLKFEVREKYDYDYIAYILDVSKIGMQYNEETVKIISKSQVEIAKQKMNGKGSYLIMSINEIHSPDSNIQNTVRELILLIDNQIISQRNEISKKTVKLIEKYGTFLFLQDLS